VLGWATQAAGAIYPRLTSTSFQVAFDNLYKFLIVVSNLYLNGMFYQLRSYLLDQIIDAYFVLDHLSGCSLVLENADC